MDTDDRCLIDGCVRKAFSRGLCQKCLGAARTKISIGRVTEEALVAAGLMLKAKKSPGRPPSTPFGKAAAKSKKREAKR
jgi:hypothetical protein